MQKFIFTFGGNQPLAGRCQPIFAKNSEEARSKMFEIYGDKWGFEYTNETWEKMLNDPERMWTMETELEPIYA